MKNENAATKLLLSVLFVGNGEKSLLSFPQLFKF